MSKLFWYVSIFSFVVVLSLIGCKKNDASSESVGAITSGGDCSNGSSNITYEGKTVLITGTTAVPYDVDEDKLSPNTSVNFTGTGTVYYAFKPQIIVKPWTKGAILAWNEWNSTSGSTGKVILSIVDMSGSSYTMSHTEIDSLKDLLGFEVDDNDNAYVMTGDGNSVSSNGGGDGVHADNVTDIQKFNSSLVLQYRKSMNFASYDSSKNAIRSPSFFGSSRIAYGNSKLGLHFSRQGNEDSQNLVHQGSMFLQVNTSDGSIVKDSYLSGHSWDLRLIYDSNIGEFIGLDLSDMFGRGIIFSSPFNSFQITSDSGSYSNTTSSVVYGIKGGDMYGSQNPVYQWTFSRLGDVAVGSAGYPVLFSTEKSTEVAGSYVHDSKNLALMHVKSDWKTPSYYDSSAFFGNGEVDNRWVTNDPTLSCAVTNNPQSPYLINGKQKSYLNKGVVWLTNYTDKAAENAQKPKIVKVDTDKFLILWEKWKASSLTSHNASNSGKKDDFVSTYAMAVDQYGNVLAPEKNLGSTVRLHNGDDLTVIDGKAVWVTGDAETTTLTIHTISLK
jgi:hypothetical protein